MCANGVCVTTVVLDCTVGTVTVVLVVVIVSCATSHWGCTGARGVMSARFRFHTFEARASQIVYEQRAHISDNCLQIRVVYE